MKKKICICTNEKSASLETRDKLFEMLSEKGFLVSEELFKDTELLISIGGDGATLAAIHKFDFPSVPIIGINTGHLGFFQEINPDQLDQFILDYMADKYVLQPMATVEAMIIDGAHKHYIHGLNEIAIKGSLTSSTHLNISIGDNFIEKFSGDGIVVSTPAGSTAYNYSVGGSIVDPRLKLLQVAPIAPMNTNAYRSFTSSLMLPPDLSLTVEPESKDLSIITDGFVSSFSNVSKINIKFSDSVINLLRFESYEFWNKVTSKFLKG